jgi:hypothetical protein
VFRIPAMYFSNFYSVQTGCGAHPVTYAVCKSKVVPVSKHYAMKAYGGLDVYIHVFLTSALVGGEWSGLRPGCFVSGEGASGTHWIGSWVDPRAGLDDVEKKKFFTIPGLEPRLLRRPARSQSLYHLGQFTLC